MGTTSRNLDAAHWALALAPVLAYDAWLIASGKDSLSARGGRHPVAALAFVAYLGCHLMSRPRCLSRFDPLHLAAERIRRR